VAFRYYCQQNLSVRVYYYHLWRMVSTARPFISYMISTLGQLAYGFVYWV